MAQIESVDRTIIAHPAKVTNIIERGPRLPKYPDPSNSTEALNWFSKEIKLPTYLQPYFEETLKLYDEFNRGTGLTESFHNGYHALAVTHAASLAFEAITKGKDPLGLASDLALYNQLNNTDLGLEDLRLAYLIAGPGHDLGDILKSAKKNYVGEIETAFHQYYGVNIYTSNKTEALSAQQIPIFAEKYIDKNQLPIDQQSKLNQIIKLAQHITEQTTFIISSEDEQKPFAFSTRIFDQLGNAACNPLGTRAIVVLLYEKYLETAINTPEFQKTLPRFAYLDPNTFEEKLFLFAHFLNTVNPKTPLSNRDNPTGKLINEIDVGREFIDEDGKLNSPFAAQLRNYLNFFEVQGENLCDLLLLHRTKKIPEHTEISSLFAQIKSLWPTLPHQHHIVFEEKNMKVVNPPMTMHMRTLAKRLYNISRWI